MNTKLLEVTNGPMNHGKFLVGRFDTEWERQCLVDAEAGTPIQRTLLLRCGWTPNHVMVFDLQTGEGGLFRLGGYAHADLQKTRVWVCPLFEPFLGWLYTLAREHPASWFQELPERLDLPSVPFQMQGYRRPGSHTEP